MGSIEPPRPADEAARTVAPRSREVREPPTDRALWPTFMRRTLEDEVVRAAREDKHASR